MYRPRISRNEHEKRKHKLSHQEQQDLIATPWDIWERKEIGEYMEPEYKEEEEEEAEQGKSYIWIEARRTGHRERKKKTDINMEKVRA
jgi:hypothetical protein